MTHVFPFLSVWLLSARSPIYSDLIMFQSLLKSLTSDISNISEASNISQISLIFKFSYISEKKQKNMHKSLKIQQYCSNLTSLDTSHDPSKANSNNSALIGSALLVTSVETLAHKYGLFPFFTDYVQHIR